MPAIEVQSFTTGSMSAEDRAKVREQMNRLLETHHFKNSRRYPALLRFIVEETLDGRGDQLKERLLGISVFDRPADYDTATDPIVRVTIAEIRKRIAQYYHDEEHDAEIRIELMPGRYAPEFRARREHSFDRISALAEVQEPFRAAPIPLPEVLPAPVLPSAKPRRSRRVLWSLSSALVLLLVAIPVVLHLLPTSALDDFWAPILLPHKTVIFCMPSDLTKGSPEKTSLSAPSHATTILPGGPTFRDHEVLGENVVYSDMLALLSVVNILAPRHREYQVKLDASTTLDDLRPGPAVLIGGLDNPWTLRSLSALPYQFAGSDEVGYWITNQKDPASRAWSLDLKQHYSSVTRDYALVARIHNEQTGQPEVLMAGIGMSGTAAAGEFVGNEALMKELRGKIGSRFRDHDFEVVLSTDVVNGLAGSPKILAVAVW